MTAIGVLENGPDGPELRSSFVFGGTRAEYIAAQVGAAAYLPWLGSFAAVIGLTLIARNVWSAGLVVPYIVVRRTNGYNKWFILR